MKKIVIVGSGTAGLCCAAMMKNYWGNKVDISLYYDATSKNIAVGESTTPIIRLLLSHLGVTTEQFFKEFRNNASLKLGINFKNWIPGTEYFHGFGQIYKPNLNSSGVYSITQGKFNGGTNYNEATTTIPKLPFDKYDYALHLDTQEFSEYVTKKLKGKIDLVDDLVEEVIVDGENITSIRCRDSGIVEADLFIDASGFNAVLFKHLNPKWNDLSDSLPLDRAIPQQVPNNSNEIPSHTVAEATENGWIWQLPIGDRFGTGYIYSSRFTSDEEAREKYNEWLLKNHNAELQTDRIIRYRPGYYEDYWIGNCLAIGLSSGFVEPLESTGIQIILSQVQEFMTINSTLNNLQYNRVIINKANRKLYEEIIDFICLHYNTNRTDSEFWRYMTANKVDWVKNFDEKCREEFLDARTCHREKTFWILDSYIQIAKGLNMVNNQSIKNFLEYKIDGRKIWDEMKNEYRILEIEKKRWKWISHKDAIS